MPSRFDRLKYRPFLQAALIGLLAGTSAFIFKQGVGLIGTIRIQLANQYPNWLVLPCIGLFGGILAGWIVEKYAPEAAGSGVPQVKARLHGFESPLTLKTAGVKLLGGIIALGSGMRLGKEGPTVQSSAALANWAQRFFPYSESQERQLIAAGSGAGLAAAFNTPIAGLMFVVEELMRDFSNLTLGTAILACFVGGVTARLFGNLGLGVDITCRATDFFSVRDIPVLLIVGFLAGIIGAIFNRAILFSTQFQQSLSLSLTARVAIAGLISGITIAALPPIFQDNTGLKELLMGNQDTWQIAAIAFVSQFFLTVIAYGAGAPGGLFSPVLILGGSMGYLVDVVISLLPNADLSSTYALVGMGAFFSATIRVPITSIVIMFEMTQDFNLILPLMLACVVAYLVGDFIAPGSLYDRLLLIAGIDLDKAEE